MRRKNMTEMSIINYYCKSVEIKSAFNYLETFENVNKFIWILFILIIIASLWKESMCFIIRHKKCKDRLETRTVCVEIG